MAQKPISPIDRSAPQARPQSVQFIVLPSYKKTLFLPQKSRKTLKNQELYGF
jgi:hypothetical protein